MTYGTGDNLPADGTPGTDSVVPVDPNSSPVPEPVDADSLNPGGQTTPGPDPGSAVGDG